MTFTEVMCDFWLLFEETSERPARVREDVSKKAPSTQHSLMNTLMIIL